MLSPMNGQPQGHFDERWPQWPGPRGRWPQEYGQGPDLPLLSSIRMANNRFAAENRRRFAAAGVRVIELVGSDGAGKTALLEATLPRLFPELRAGLIVSDLAARRDTQRTVSLGVPVVQVASESFGGICHLEACSIRQAIELLDLYDLDLLFIENIGDLALQGEFDLGQDGRVLLLSLAQEEDQPLVYPLAVRTADLAVINKSDLTNTSAWHLHALRENLRQVNPWAECLVVSARTGEGLNEWLEWLNRWFRCTTKFGAEGC